MNSNMHVENMKSLLEKINLYKRNELVLYGELKEQFESIKYCFDNSSSNIFDEKINELYNKFSIISKIHDNNILVINKNIEKYLNTSVKVSQIFDDIAK